MAITLWWVWAVRCTHNIFIAFIHRRRRWADNCYKNILYDRYNVLLVAWNYSLLVVEKIIIIAGSRSHIIIHIVSPHINTIRYRPNTCICAMIPANKTRWNNVGLMLGHRRRRWANIKTTLFQCVVCLLEYRTDGRECDESDLITNLINICFVDIDLSQSIMVDIRILQRKNSGPVYLGTWAMDMFSMEIVWVCNNNIWVGNETHDVINTKFRANELCTMYVYIAGSC